MIRNKWHRWVLSFLVLLFLGSLSSTSSAEIIDDITLNTGANGEVDVQVKFTVPIQYLRHFPQGKTPFAAIYFNILNTVPAGDWQDYETHRAPPSDIIQDITVSTRDRGTGPKVQIRFQRAVEFNATLGANGQSLVIHIKPEVVQPKNENKPVTEAAVSVAAPLLAATGAAVEIAAKTPLPVAATAAMPVVAVSAAAEKPAAEKPAVATAAVQPVAASAVSAVPAATAAPAISVAPSGDVTAPKAMPVTAVTKPVHIPLGGKEDGLPIYPDIVLMVSQGKTVPSEKQTLTDQIIKANNQAAALMEKGGNALLAGQPFAAIDSFNSVLNLPPNQYTQDAQLWIGISRERTGQMAKAILEFNSYLKLYPDAKSVKWVKDRLDKLKASQPALFNVAATPASTPLIAKNTEFQFSEFGSLSMTYYQGASQTNTPVTAGSSQSPTSFSTTDQKSLMTNVNVTARSYNNEYDNRLVFQDFYAANFLVNQKNSNRLGAAYYELKDRIVNYSVKVGRQSGMGGGVMGRFDGLSAGYGFSQDWKANIVTGQLSDVTLDAKPKFIGLSLDFGVKSPLGGSAYLINQKVGNITDRRAVGGNLRYFDQGFTAMSMIDYDIQFKALNMITVQGTVTGVGSGVGAGTDFNFLLDRRRSPMLDIRNAVSGTTTSLATLIENGWTMSDLVLLANQRTTTTNAAQVGMTNRLDEKWIIGTDISASNTAGLAASGGIIDPIAGCIATEGCVGSTPSSGVSWTVSERLTGLGIFQPRDVSNLSLSYTKSKSATAQAIQFSNHSDIQEKWALDSTMRLGFQSDTMGGKSNDLSPTARVTYKFRNNLTFDSQLGLSWAKTSSSILQTSSTSLREYASLGFQLSF